MSSARTKSKWWVVAVVSPLAVLIMAALVIVFATPGQNDWLGMGVFAPIAILAMLGCILCFGFTVVSLKKHEEGAFYALLVSVPLLVFIVSKMADFPWHDFFKHR